MLRRPDWYSKAAADLGCGSTSGNPVSNGGPSPVPALSRFLQPQLGKPSHKRKPQHYPLNDSPLMKRLLANKHRSWTDFEEFDAIDQILSGRINR